MDRSSSAFSSFSPQQWAALAAATPGPAPETGTPGGATSGGPPAGGPEGASSPDIPTIYRPLSRLLHHQAIGLQRTDRRPYLIGITGGVAVGKTTTAQLLVVLIGAWSPRIRVELATTDGFLYPNHELEARGLASMKGCPESYDERHLVRFLSEVRSGQPEVRAPVYSHETYDVVPGRAAVFRRPDVLILEGVNVLDATSGVPPSVADLLDFSIYLDADEQDIERWFVERFLMLCRAAQDDPGAFYHRFAAMGPAQIDDLAHQVWSGINGPNLRTWVQPTRFRADLILEKGPDHAVRWVRQRGR